MKIIHKLSILYIVVGIIPLVVGILYLKIFSQSETTKEYMALHESFLSNSQYFINHFFHDAHRRLLSLAVSIQGYTVEEIRRKDVFKNFLLKNLDFQFLGIASPSSSDYSYTLGRTAMGTEYSIQNKIDWVNICKEGWLVGKPYRPGNSDEYMIKLAVPIRFKGNKCNVLVGELKFSPVHLFIGKNRFLNSGNLALLDNGGRALSSNFPEQSPSETSYIYSKLKDLISEGDNHVFTITNSRGQELMVAYAPIKEIQGEVISFFPKSMLSRDENKIVWFLLLSTVLALGLALIFSRISHRYIKEPVEVTKKFLTNLESGKFDRQFSINNNNNEFSDLIVSFNRIGKNLKTLKQSNMEQLQTEQTKTKAIIDSLADGIIVVNKEMEIILANPMALDILNEPLKAGDRLSGSNSPIATVMADIFSRAFVKEGEVFYGELNFGTHFHGRQRTIEVLANGVRHQNGVLVGMVAVLRDITKEKEMERMRSNISSLLSHEIKNPLASIIGMSEIIATDMEIDPVTNKNFCQSIFKHSKRIQALVNDFLDLSRLEDGSIVLKREILNLKKLVEETLLEQEYHINQNNIRIRVQIQDDDLFIVGDRNLLKQAFNNLISNGIKYNRENGKIDIVGGKTKKTFRLIFSDTGIGIKEENIPKIFQRFYRIHSPDTQDIEGTGLGLPFVKEIIDRHGGQITVESKYKHGTRFVLDFPCRV